MTAKVRKNFDSSAYSPKKYHIYSIKQTKQSICEIIRKRHSFDVKS